MAGAIGLRMESLPFVLEMQQVPKKDWAQVTQGVRVMERETLRLWRSQSGS